MFTIWFNLKRYNEIQVSICIIDMTKDESPLTFLRYKNLSDMLKVILFSSQSALGLTPMLYHITYKEKDILFIETGALGGALVHYIVENEKPNKKFIELRQLTGEHTFAEKIGTDTHSIYIPILELDSTSIEFPM
jgi:ABC-type cobalt transport system substrate-binding protein